MDDSAGTLSNAMYQEIEGFLNPRDDARAISLYIKAILRFWV